MPVLADKSTDRRRHGVENGVLALTITIEVAFLRGWFANLHPPRLRCGSNRREK